MRQQFALAMLAACVLGLFFPGVAVAGTGGTLSLPNGRAKIKNGLRVEIDSRWVDGNGYRPIRVKLIPWPPGPTTFARTIRVELKPRLRYGGVAETDASAFIEIPEGAASVTRVICVPQNSSWGNVSVRFYEEGVRLKDLESAIGFPPFAVNNQTWSEAQPSILMLDADAPKIAERDVRIAEMISDRKKSGGSFTLPDVRGLIATQPQEGFIHFKFDPEEASDDAELLQGLAKAPRLEIIPPSDMPERWLEWTNVDIIFISLADLKNMARQETQKFAVLREYISTGATLCVHGAGEKFRDLKTLEQILQTPPLEGAEQKKYRAWRAPNPHTYTPDVAGIAVSNPGLNSYVSPYATANGVQQDPQARAREIAAEAKVEKTKKRTSPDPPNFVIRSYGLGRVVAFHQENPFPGSAADWGWFFNELGSGAHRSNASWMWYQRHGMSHSRTNPGFWNFLVPGVGRPPVTAFLTVISLFVILIGPINYLLLVRTGRLYLLLVTVPLGAGIVTLSLFGFALFTDGLHVRARVRSFTQLNQRQGRAVSWSRQTYYAALRPSGGLTFPPTAAVYPLEQKPTQRYLQRSRKTLHWEENQYLTRGYISPRLPAQFMVINSDKTPAKLVVTADKEGSPPGVKNQLGAPILHLLMRQADGRYFWAENIEPGAAAQTASIELQPVLKKLVAIYRAHPLALPENYDAKTLNAALQYGVQNVWYARGNSDGSLSEPSPSTSLLEQNLRSVFKAKSHPLAPGEFVAVLKNSPQTPQGVAGARQELGFHVIKGSW